MEIVEVAVAVRRLASECCVPTWSAASAINDANGCIEQARQLLNAGITRLNYTRMNDEDSDRRDDRIPTLQERLPTDALPKRTLAG